MTSTVLCATADDEHLHDVVATGRALARSGGFRPVFVHVAEAAVPGSGRARAGASVDELGERAREEGRRLLADAGIAEDESLVVVGDAPAELDRLAAEHDARAVVVGTHRRGALARAALGSVSRALVERGTRPVLIVRGTALPDAEGPVVAAVDARDEAGAIDAPVDVAAGLAASIGRPLVLASVVGSKRVVGAAGPLAPPTELPTIDTERRQAARALDAVAARAGVDDVECMTLEESPVAATLDELATARRAALLVVGAPRTRGLRRALEGSVAFDLARGRGRPLVVVAQ